MRIKPALIFLLFLLITFCQKKDGDYMCKPCDLECDELSFNEPGICPHCKMDLIKKSDLIDESELEVNAIDIQDGSGVFLIDGGKGNDQKNIKIYYHKPKNFTEDSKILLVIPGAGRNGDTYRDAWIKESEKYSILILSPMYMEDDYDFGAYHLGGLVYDLNLEEAVEFDQNSNRVFLDEEKFSFQINSNKEEWIYKDFDRVFDMVVQALGSRQTTYDIFGHSAGGQILHRFAIFQPDSKVDRILASNSGSYTLPDFDIALPFGLKNTILEKENLQDVFNKKLVLLIGELDNENEKGGLLLRSPTVDKQGLHRLERGTYFYERSKAISKEFGLEFNWELVIVPGIGHDHRKIGDAAADFLYK